ncbi:MAG: peptidyl-alpha-hydroxyglycine alpha-amidating lyase family protein [Opitutus sp.]
MNPVRARPFTHSARTRLQPVDGWPKLPAHITLDRVVGVALDSVGRVYVAHRGHHPLLCFDANGRFLREIGSAHHRESIAYDLRGPTPVPIATRIWLHGLHVDPWDNVWITDVSRHLVMKFDPAGELVLTLGTDGVAGCDDRHFFQPTHVCVLPSGEFFVTDGYGNSRIVKFSANGKRLFEWGQRGTLPGEFHTPHVITRGDDGLLYMTDRENDRIQIFDANGKLQAVWPDLHSVDGLYCAADGSIYGSAGIDNAILCFDRSGQLLDAWVHPGLFNYPHAVAVDRSGAIYVAETGDQWLVTGRLPAEREMLARSGPERSAVRKLVRAARNS